MLVSYFLSNDLCIQGGSKKVSCCTESTAYFFWATL